MSPRTHNGLSVTSVRGPTDARRTTGQRGVPGVRLRLVCSFALAQVQRELAEIVATPTRISLYGDGERGGAPEECRLCYNLPMLQGGYLRGADYDQTHSYQSCCPHSLYFCRFGRASDSSSPRDECKCQCGCVSGRLDGRRE